MSELEKIANKFSVLDHIPTGVCVLRKDFKVVYWNRCLENWTHILKHEIIETDISKWIPHFKEPKYINRLQQVFLEGLPTIFSSQLYKHLIPAYLSNGKLRIQHTTVTAEPAPEGGYYALLFVQDITEFSQQAENYRRMRDEALAEVQERQQAEASLQQAKERLEAVLDAVPGLVSWISSDLRYIGVNHHLCTTFNQPQSAFIDKEIGFLDSSISFANFIASFIGSNNKTDSRIIDAKVNNELRKYLIVAQKYQQDRAVVAVGIDITEQKQVEEKLKASLKEKEILLKEIHHRVKNNLQVISSLLKLQSEYIKDPQGLLLLSDSYNRVRAMALIHEKLYQSEGLASIDASDYIASLGNNLMRSYKYLCARVNLKIEVENIFFNINTAIPCGLIVNELVSNSLKYGFPNEKLGTIQIRLTAIAPDRLVLKVSDNGIGLPPDFNIETIESFGLQLVYNLTNQLEGEIEIYSQGGTIFKISFPQEPSFN